MNYRLIKKYIASHLATPTASLTEVHEPLAGILFKDGDNSSFFYPDPQNETIFFEQYGELRYKHEYNAVTHNFKSIKI
ncbi:hypothetical protein ACLJJ6_09860 [Pediococcus siamensis]|uniref:hypothetical protein n=1 Tax=Pediococcus siamensis TaxID=381829 RepID=UPI0039A18533